MAEQLKEYKVGDFTFQLNAEDVKRLRDNKVEVKAVTRADNKATTPQNKGA